MDFPGGQTIDEFLANTPHKEDIIKVAELTRKIFDDIAEREIQAGVLKGTRENYFPHLMKRAELTE